MSTTEKPGIRLRFFRNVRSAKWRNLYEENHRAQGRDRPADERVPRALQQLRFRPQRLIPYPAALPRFVPGRTRPPRPHLNRRNPAMKKITVRKAGTVRLTSVSHALYSSCTGGSLHNA